MCWMILLMFLLLILHVVTSVDTQRVGEGSTAPSTISNGAGIARTGMDSSNETCVVDMWIGEINDDWTGKTLRLIEENHRNWAACHGYSYIHQTNTLEAKVKSNIL